IGRDDDGWRISPTLNLFFIAGLVGLVWLATDSSVGDPEARKRLFRLRTNLVLAGLAMWFFFGPSIGDVGLPDASPPATVQGTPASVPPNGHPTLPVGQQPPSSPSHGHTSQFTWGRPAAPRPEGTWKPGDGLRAMAQMLEDATGQGGPAGK
ncbi:MAG TPA: hypothetical protein VFI31_01665, partial [Pirellulales bacterium]|nr:hypothetical protein [Pirellulales bacterium]